MRPFTHLSFYIFLLITVFLGGCNTSKKVQSVETTEAKPEVIVETKAAIVGGLDALQSVLEYPPKAQKEGVETELIANVLINKKGEVEQISFDNETEYNFEEAARNALYQVEFRAGERNGEPINMYISIPITFEL